MYLGQADSIEIQNQIDYWKVKNKISDQLWFEFMQWRRIKYPKPEVPPGVSVPAVMDYWIPKFKSLAEFMLEWREFEDYAGIEEPTPAAVRPSEYPIYEFMRPTGLVFSSPLVTENIYKMGFVLVGGYLLIKLLLKR
jgi:hypothetical protein